MTSRHLMFLCSAWCLSASAAIAQRAKPGRIEGVVTDSVHARPLAGALVLLARPTTDTTISKSDVTDENGRFAFEDLPPGKYVVGIESELLDSLELAVPAQSVSLASGERTHLVFGTPSARALRALACPATALPQGTGAVIGRLADAHDSTPLAGAAIVIGWSETIVDRATLRTTNTPQSVELKTDSLGRFHVCGVPLETYLDLRVSLASYREVMLQLAVPEAVGVWRQHIELAREDQLPERTATPDNGKSSESGALASLRGTVYGRSAPLSRVEVQRQGDSVVVSTDSLGRYHLVAVPLGIQVVEVRRLGYLPRQLALGIHPGENGAPDLHLSPVVTLDSVQVVGRRTKYPEFDERAARLSSFGHFLRAEDIARKNPLLTSDLVQQMVGFRIVRRGTSDQDVAVLSSHGDIQSLHRPGPCFANIIIDGVPHQQINAIDPSSIGGMEIYPGPFGPVQYRSECGTILIWTKRP